MKRHGYKQGTYRPKHAKKYVGSHPIVYRSGWELKFFRWCDLNENVLEWTSESIVIPYINPTTGRGQRYFVDSSIALKENNKVVKYLIEIKPKKQTIPPKYSKRKKKSTLIYEASTYAKNKAKWAAAEKWCQKKGYKFMILTEEELF
jgi:hypothetical protein